MGYWGWRPLVSALFLCVWIVGCNIISGAASLASPTSPPQVTLTLRKVASRTPPATATPPAVTTTEQAAVPTSSPAPHAYVVRPGDTLLGIALDFGLSVEDLQLANPAIDPLALQVGQALVIPQPGLAVAAASTPIGLTLDAPVCYDLITGSILCLGLIVNRFDQALQQVQVRVGLLDAAGGLVAEAITGIDQRVIPPHESAPYSVIIRSRPYTSTSASLMSADIVPMPQDLVVLQVLEARVEQQDRRYRLMLTLRNPSDRATGPARLVLTLLDADGQVTGFRVQNTAEGLDPGATVTVEIEAQAQGSSGPLSHQIYAEAQQQS